MTAIATDFSLVPMDVLHVPGVIAIEASVYPQPWSAKLFLSEIALPSDRDYTVVLMGERLVGYTGLTYVHDEAHVTTIAVDSAFQGRRIATRLMLHNVALCVQRGVRAMTLEVRSSNEPAVALYRRFGFAPAGVRPGYYSHPKEDALIMWAHDIDSPAFAERTQAIEERVTA